MAGHHSFGRGRGRGSAFNYYPPMEAYDYHLERPVTNWINPDPRTQNYKIHVKKIPNNWSKSVVENFFSRVGEPLNVFMGQPPHPNATVKWAFVEFATFQEARAAVQELNNNEKYGFKIEVSFAREKQEYSYGHSDGGSDEILSFPLSKASEKRVMERKRDDDIQITLKNDKRIRTGLPESAHMVVVNSAKGERIIQKSLLAYIAKLDREELPAYGKCVRCDTECNLVCVCSVQYCSTDCLSKDWPDHYKNCQVSAEASDCGGSVKSDLGGGDNNQGRHLNQTNRYRSNERDYQRDGRENDGRPNNRFSDRSSSYSHDRPNNNFGNRSSNRFNDRRNHSPARQNGGGNRADSNCREDQRNMFEERKMKYFSKKSDEPEGSSSRRFNNNHTERREDFGSRNNRRTLNAHEIKCEDEDWNSSGQVEKNIGENSEGTLNLLGDKFLKSETEFLNKPEVSMTVTGPNKLRQTTALLPTVTRPQTAENRLTLGDPETSGDMWVVQIVGESYPESASIPPASAQQTTVASSNHLLPADVFTEVLVKQREPTYFSVTPTGKLEELQRLSDNIQSLALSAIPISPKVMSKCIVKLPKDNKWYRGRIEKEIVEEECAIQIKLVDEGGFITIQHSPSNLKALPSQLESIPTFITYVRPNESDMSHHFAQDVVAVKPLRKDTDKIWLVNVKPVVKTEPVESVAAVASPSTSKTLVTPVSTPSDNSTYPLFMPPDQFSTVLVSVTEDSKAGDVYYVGPLTLFTTLDDMSKNFRKRCGISEKLSVTGPGLVGISFYDNYWYRSKVVSVEPLKVLLMDYGMVIPIEPSNIRNCPNEYKDMKPLVQRVQVAPETDKKYLNLPESSEISIKPITLVSNDTFLVHVKGETYSSTVVKQESTVSPPQPDSISSQRTASSESSRPTAPLVKQELQFPDIFNSNGYTSVLVTYAVKSESGPTDTYYVGLESVWLTEMTNMTAELNRIAEQCPIVPPELGDVFLSYFVDGWYRVRVISLTPLKVFYLDFGNTESGNVLRECPKHLKTLQQPVHKVKLAPLTSTKYLGLSELDYPSLSLKPIAMLPGGTTVVEVEEKSDNEVPAMEQAPTVEASNTTVEQAPTVEASNTTVEQAPTVEASNTTVEQAPLVEASNTTVEQAPLVEASNTTVEQAPLLEASNATVEQAPTVVASNTTVEQAQPAIDQSPPQHGATEGPKHVVNLLCEDWKVTFMSQEMDSSAYELKGTLYTSHLPETLKLTLEENLEKIMENSDPILLPEVGEVVGCKHNDIWVRAEVTGDVGVLSLVDSATFLRGSCEKKRLPEEYVRFPRLGVTFTVPYADHNILNGLHKLGVVELTVEKYDEDNGERRVHVRGKLNGTVLFGSLQPWKCRSGPETPYPLVDGDSVMFSDLLDSNTAIVCSRDCDMIEHEVQSDGYKSCCEALKTAPNVGDYVVLKWEEVYYRVEVEKVNAENGECTLYKVDYGSRETRAFSHLYPLPSSLLKLFRRAIPIKLKDVDKVDKDKMTEESKLYIQAISSAQKPLSIKFHEDFGTVTLFKSNNENVNEKLQELIKPKITGKFTLSSLPMYKPPLNKEIAVVVVHKEPLHVGVSDVFGKFLNDLNMDIQVYCQNEHAKYNPFVGELCLVQHEIDGAADWYRSVCLMESNVGISHQLLLDYGTPVNVTTECIRRIQPEHLVVPALGLPATIIGLSDEERVKVANQFEVYANHTVIIESIDKDNNHHMRVLTLKL